MNKMTREKTLRTLRAVGFNDIEIIVNELFNQLEELQNRKCDNCKFENCSMKNQAFSEGLENFGCTLWEKKQ